MRFKNIKTIKKKTLHLRLSKIFEISTQVINIICLFFTYTGFKLAKHQF